MGDSNAIYRSHLVNQSKWETLPGLKTTEEMSEIQVRNLYFPIYLYISMILCYILLFGYFATLLCCHVAMLLCRYVVSCYNSLFLCYHVAMLLCFYVVMLLCWYFTISFYVTLLLWCYSIKVICCYVSVLFCCYVMLLCYSVAKLLCVMCESM